MSFTLDTKTATLRFNNYPMSEHGECEVMHYTAGDSGRMIVKLPSYKYWNTENKLVDSEEKCLVLYIDNIKRERTIITGDYYQTIDFKPELFSQIIPEPMLPVGYDCDG